MHRCLKATAVFFSFFVVFVLFLFCFFVCFFINFENYRRFYGVKFNRFGPIVANPSAENVGRCVRLSAFLCA